MELPKFRNDWKPGNDYSLNIRKILSSSHTRDIAKEYKKIPGVRYFSEKYESSQVQMKNTLHKQVQPQRNRLKCNSQKLASAQVKDSPNVNAIGLILNEWINRARGYLINITDDILRAFAQEIAEVLKSENFKPTNSWLIQFKQKYRIFNYEVDIKQEIDVSAESRKPLGIMVIIDDMRERYGETMIPYARDSGNVGKVEQKELLGNSIQPLMGDQSRAETLKTTKGFAKKIKDYREALNHLGPLEQFALLNENIRAIGLINQLENLFQDVMADENN